MLEQEKEQLEQMRSRLVDLRSYLDLDQKTDRVKELEKLIAQPDFWTDTEKSQSILQERKGMEKLIEQFSNLEKEIDEGVLMLELAEEEGDEAAVAEVRSDLGGFEDRLRGMELKRMLGGPDDGRNAIVLIHSGAGGTEAQDWAEMLLRMYLRWAERRGFSTTIVDYQPGEDAGIKSATFTAEADGEYVYGHLRAEVGIHRLVRISPFDAGARRHTSFASVFVYPAIADEEPIEIDEKDLKIDTYRAGGAGGQHVNKTDSAVRITHIPSGIIVQCQNERSQHKNKAMAMKVLRARLYEKRKDEEAERLGEIHKSKKEIAWGSQIRSYVLQPYRMVKDHRTSLDIGNVDSVLDGDIDRFIEAYLLQS
ncbi:peptide chain release factor 2 [Thermodesulfobacteriota bacterium]